MERVARLSVARPLEQLDERRVIGRGVAPELLVRLLRRRALLDRLEHRGQSRGIGASDIQPDGVSVDAQVRIAAEPAVRALSEQNVPAELDVRRRPVREQVGGGHVVGAVQPAGVLVEHRRGGLDVLLARGSNHGHAGTSSSRVSGRFARSVSSRSGSGPGCFVEPVDPDRAQAELARRRDVVEEARRDVDVCSRSAVVASKKRSQCPCAGL